MSVVFKMVVVFLEVELVMVVVEVAVAVFFELVMAVTLWWW